MTYEEYDVTIRNLIVKAGWCEQEHVATWVGNSHAWPEHHALGVPAEKVAEGECNAAADQHS